MEMKSFFTGMDRNARIGLIAGIALIVVATAGVLWWTLRPQTQLLFGNLRESDAAEIVQSLDEWKIPHEIGDGGTSIRVPADKVYDTRMKLVSAGVPRGGHVGFELFDDADFGVTEFAQRVNFQRALQGEIERTISALPGVETARVHLTIRRQGLFVGERDASKASVALTLRPGTTLTREQIGGVRSLVAAAVEGLSPAQVSVLDSDGSLLAAAGDGRDELLTGDKAEQESRIESALQAKVEAVLGRVLHDEQFGVTVDATLNFDAIHQVNERPIAEGDDGNGLLSRKRSQNTEPDAQTGRGRNEEESEYVHGTAREEISRAPGRIERLSVAVVLPATLDEFEVPRIRALIAAAAGIDANRGDLLEVSRVGRDAWRPGNAPPSAPANANATTVSAPRVSSLAIAPQWTRWALAAAVGLLVGAILAIGLQKRPRRLSVQEREAALSRMRTWLSEGGGIA